MLTESELKKMSIFKIIEYITDHTNYSTPIHTIVLYSEEEIDSYKNSESNIINSNIIGK